MLVMKIVVGPKSPCSTRGHPSHNAQSRPALDDSKLDIINMAIVHRKKKGGEVKEPLRRGQATADLLVRTPLESFAIPASASLFQCVRPGSRISINRKGALDNVTWSDNMVIKKDPTSARPPGWKANMKIQGLCKQICDDDPTKHLHKLAAKCTTHRENSQRGGRELSCQVLTRVISGCSSKSGFKGGSTSGVADSEHKVSPIGPYSSVR